MYKSLCTPHVVGSLGDRPARALVVAAPSGLARLVAATGTLTEAEPPDMGLFDRIAAEIGDEMLRVSLEPHAQHLLWQHSNPLSPD